MPLFISRSIIVLFFLSLFNGASPTLMAQPLVADSTQVHRWMTSLAAPNMYGRGYVNGGLDSAAAFIVHELQALGLQATRLPFAMPVNTFPHKVHLAINGRKLLPGRDFLVGPESVSFHGTASLEQADSNVWIDARKKIIFETADKLTWSVATEQAAFTRFTVVKTAWPSALRKVEAEVEAVYDSTFTASNILAVIPGTRRPDSMLVFTAHYDHLGMMGAHTTFAGANDNASGAALLLALAAYYAKHNAAYSVAFLFFAGEEAGLYGSKVFTDQPAFPIDKVRFLLNLDLVGNGDEGITVVNATEFPAEYRLLQQINEQDPLLVAINSRGKAQNSDHYYFTEKGVPSFFWYTLGKRKAYHDVDDVSSTLPFYEANDLQRLIIRFSEKVISLPRHSK
jgi:hypothetical protein